MTRRTSASAVSASCTSSWRRVYVEVFMKHNFARSDATSISCSKLRGDKRPLEVQSLPERLVLLGKVPKGEEIHNVFASDNIREAVAMVGGHVSISR